MSLSLITINVGAPSIERAHRQLQWLAGRSEDVFVLIGAYVPSRDATADKTERKKTWIERFQAALDLTASDAPLLLLGDLNVLEPTHKPAHRGSSHRSNTPSTAP